MLFVYCIYVIYEFFQLVVREPKCKMVSNIHPLKGKEIKNEWKKPKHLALFDNHADSIFPPPSSKKKCTTILLLEVE